MKKKAFTLVELIVATCVFLIAIVGILYSFLKCQQLAELGKNSSIALQASKNEVEDIKNANFTSLFATYNNATFTAAGLNGKGVVYVDNTNPSLLQIKVVFCWKQQNGLVVGEDKNLNGVLDAGEDKNANGKLDSTVQIITDIYG